MIAVETNILIYAHRRDCLEHKRALARLTSLIESGLPWAIPWPCVHEFISTVTKPVFRPSSTVEQAFDALESLLESEHVHLLGESHSHLSRLRRLCVKGLVSGGAIHDARIAAICLEHGVTELWSADRDFSRFPDLRIVNPIVQDSA